MNQIELHQGSGLSEVMDYAKAVASANLLPAAYRGKPADIMIAVGLGQSMGLSPAESLYRIDVIQGKPAASAELIAANVRKAGHKLRVKVTEEPPSATCTIVRADDPDEPTVVVRDMAWAKKMDLTGKDNYKKQPATMLSWRAISACARLACPEALYGVGYTPDELADDPRPTVVHSEVATTGADRMRGMLGQPAPEPVEVVGDVMLDVESPLAKAMFAAMGEAGFTDRAERLSYVGMITGRDVASSTDLTEDEARTVLKALDDLRADGGAA